MIRMLTGITRIGKRIFTPHDGPFEADTAEQERLVKLGVAVYVAAAPTVCEEEKFSGDANIVNTPEAESPAESATEPESGIEQMQQLTVAQLKKLAAEFGLDVNKLRKKEELIAAILEASAEEEMPELDMEEPIV